MNSLAFWVWIDGVKHRVRLGDPVALSTNLIYPSDALFPSDTLFPVALSTNLIYPSDALFPSDTLFP